MSSIDPEHFLNQPIYAMDFQFMVGDLTDFLDSAERAIEQQYHQEFEAIQRQAETEDSPEGLRKHLQENADHRFKVSLPLRVRYGALLGLTTSVDWATSGLVKWLREPLSKTPEGCNPTVHRLLALDARARLGKDEVVRDYEALVRVRNCVAHGAGVVSDCKYRDTLPEAIARLVGFSIGNWHFIGEHICIHRGALNRYIRSMSELVVALHGACHEQGLLKIAEAARVTGAARTDDLDEEG